MYHPRKLPKVEPGHEVVISGIAGRFPESDNVQQLQENLMKKIDLVTGDNRRWKPDFPGVPHRMGKINNLEKFDAVFFGTCFDQANSMDPVGRMLLEHVYEAIVDAGINPKQIRGSRTGVFLGYSVCESEKALVYDKPEFNSFGLMGCSRAILANRISHWLDVTGPSYTLDTGCSSSLYALEHAYRAIREGLCEAAVVGGGNVCLSPETTMQFAKKGEFLSPDGRCKTFDESANGYVRSETVAAIFLQRARDAKRVYATIIHAKTNNDGFKEQGMGHPSLPMQSVMEKEFYMECGLSPTIVDYVEAHGTGTIIGDYVEVNAIDKVFCPGRTTPLKIGSSKTVLGHAEAASALCSIAKVIIAMESGMIPPNLHYHCPREHIAALNEGRIKVITEATPWEGSYAAINAFGFGGANAHVLLKINPKAKINNSAPEDSLPRLVAVSGRTMDAVATIIDDLNNRPVDVEYIRLFHDIHSNDINGHMYRGYTLLPPRGVSELPIKDVQPYPGIKRPVWFVFSSMGSQWPGMGEALLRIPVFAEAIKKCDAALKPYGIDIFHIITNKDETAFDNVLHSFVGIAAVQIGIVDILKCIGIQPDNIIGHSFGELGCAYVDGCFTAEQTILSVYFRGKVSIETKVINGAMAVVGMGYNNIKELCPDDVKIACHNSAESATISGPAKSVKKFVAELQDKNIFASLVPCGNIAYHSHYVASFGPKLLDYMKKVCPNPKPRSNKWVSTSVPANKWDTLAAKLSSPEYHTNNLLSPVLFEETSALIPKDAIAIEIAPQGFMQAILKRALDSGVTNIPLTQKNHKDNVEVLLQAIGKMFNVGLQPQIANLYPSVEFPVSRSTRMIAPLIKWDHYDDWFVSWYKSEQNTKSSERIVKVSLADSNYEVLKDHIIGGRRLFPASGYLKLVWETVAMMHGQLFTNISVIFEDVRFIKPTTFSSEEEEVKLTVVILKDSGRFEVLQDETAVVSGYVRISDNLAAEKINAKIQEIDEEEIVSSEDIYKELRLRGYQLKTRFKGVTRCTISRLKGHIAWHNDWMVFIDNMLQMQALSMDTRSLLVLTNVKKIIVDPRTHLSLIKSEEEEEEEFPVCLNKLHDVIVSGGIEIHGIKVSSISRRKSQKCPVLGIYKFIPLCDKNEVSLYEMATLSTQMVLENQQELDVKTIELLDEADSVPMSDLLSPWILKALADVPLIQAKASIFSTRTKFNGAILPNVSVINPTHMNGDASALLVAGHQLLNRAENLKLIMSHLKTGGFLLTREKLNGSEDIEKIANSKGFEVIMVKKHKLEYLILLKIREKMEEKIRVIHVNNDKFDWVDKICSAMSEELEKETPGNTRILLVGQNNFENGLMGLINCLKQEPGGKLFRAILIQDVSAPDFSLQNPLYAKQLQKDLTINVLRANGVWGSYRYLVLPSTKPRPVHHAWVKQLVSGDLRSLTWLQGSIETGYKDKYLVNVAYFSLNSKDVMLATGKLVDESNAPNRQLQDRVIGFEYSGVDCSGKPVMGILSNKGITNICIADPNLCWEVPDNWNLEDAATIPFTYGICLYGLKIYANMKKSDKILIHSGMDTIGQAAINLALHEGCEVFTTVETFEHRQFIRENFPQINDDHIGNSLNISFKQMIMEQTNGRGVDIVLNSLEEMHQASVSCLASGGQFLEIGQFYLIANNNSPIGVELFVREISFKRITLNHIINGNQADKTSFYKVMLDYLKSGAIKPLARSVFSKDDLEAAFRHMAAGKHIGKVFIQVRDDKSPLNTSILAYPQYHCLEDRSYIVLGGLGGMGLELVDWLTLRGAKNIVIASRTGIKNGYQKMRIDVWKTYGVNINLITGKDASSMKDCEYIIRSAEKIAPVDGIFNLAAVLRDAFLSNQTPKSFEEPFRPKAWATRNLDLISRKLCLQLRHFVVFSSVFCGRGNPGSSNYEMSNSVMERICEKRVSEGLPGLAVQWGAFADVGLIANRPGDNEDLIVSGILQQKVTSCLEELEGFLLQKHPIVSSMLVAEMKEDSVVELNVVDTILSIMGLKSLKGISPTITLPELGMNSMTCLEMKQTLEHKFKLALSVQDIRRLNFKKIQEISDLLDPSERCGEVVANDMSKECEILTGMRLLMRLNSGDSIQVDPYLRLRTREENNRNEVFLIPGIESMGIVFESLAPKIKAPATSLQLGLGNNDFESIFDMADHFLPHVLKKYRDSRFFTIVGYSFGSIIAIELARRLEAKGLNGRLILIDGAPDQIKDILNQPKSCHNEVERQNKTLIDIINVVSPSKSKQLSVELESCKTWNNKVEAFAKVCPTFSINGLNQNELCNAIYSKVTAILSYDIAGIPRLKTPIVLLRPTLSSLQTDVEDYGLSKITRETVKVYYVPGYHITMLDNDEVADVINDEIIEDAKVL